MNKSIPFLVIFLLSFCPSASGADVLRFLCSWDNKSGVSFIVDTPNLTASRDEGGADHTVLKITENAVFISPKSPHSYRLEVQTLERSSGGWHDIFAYNDGEISVITGSTGIENK